MQNPTPCGVVVLFPWQRRTFWHVFSKTIFATHCLTNQDRPCQWNEGLALSCNLLQSNQEAAIVRGRVLPDEAPTSSIAFVVPPVRAPCGAPAAMLFILLRPWLCFLGGAWGGCQFSASSIHALLFHTMLAKLVLVFATPSISTKSNWKTRPFSAEDSWWYCHYLFTKKKDGAMPFTASALKQT